MTPGARIPDGYDSVEWAAAQPWSDGKVGMADGSYSGLTQYLVAPTRPPHLRALFARQADTGWYGGHNYRGRRARSLQAAQMVV